MARVSAVIVAGGQGTRMRRVDALLPKTMLPVGGKPLLEHHLIWLKASGFDEAFLCLGHQSKAITDYFGDGSRLGLRLHYQVESNPRGTAGSVRDLGKSVGGDLLVTYGDLFIKMDCRALLAFHSTHSAEATLVVRETDHPMDSDLVKLEGDRITGIYRAKSGESSGNWACAAVWALRPSLLELVPESTPSDFAKDIFPRCLAQGRALMAYRTTETVADVGTPERMEKFNRFWGARK